LKLKEEGKGEHTTTNGAQSEGSSGKPDFTEQAWPSGSGELTEKDAELSLKGEKTLITEQGGT